MTGKPLTARRRPPRARADGRITALDSLRGLVAMIVVVHHVWTVFHADIQAALTAGAVTVIDMVQTQNHRAVMAFFVLSGFTIALTTSAHLPLRAVLARDYLWRRIRRIVPLFYLSLAWTAMLGLVYAPASGAFEIPTLLGNMLFLQTSASAAGNWFVPYGGNGPYWSLSYEMFYYLTLPLLLLACGVRSGWSLHPRLAMIGIGCVALIGGLSMLKLAPNPLAHFCALWIVWIAGFTAHALPPHAKSLVILSLPAACCWLLMLLLWLGGRSSDTLSGAAEGTALALVFGCLTTWRGWARQPAMQIAARFFNACFARMGRGSYALYLMHYPLLLAAQQALAQGVEPGLRLTLVSLLVLLFAIGFCPWIERTSLDLMNRSRSPQRQPA